MTSNSRVLGIALGLLTLPGVGHAQKAAGAPAVEFGVVLDGTYLTKGLALEEERGKGSGLGHTEFTASGNIDDWFKGQATAALHSHDGATEVELEEAFVETMRLPAGLQLRAGRFLSQIGYLNGQHVHADDFTTRPLLYRGLLGTHYFDDGLRLNWVAPTDLYLRLGLEVFGGRGYIAEASNNPAVGAWTLSAKIGGDIGTSQSWQAGLSTLRNRRIAVAEEEDAEEEDAGEDLVLGGDGDGHGHDHDHAHGTAYTGARMWLADLVWKWAPGGNNRNRQLRLGAEFARVTDVNEFAGASDRHEAYSIAAVYRFHPQWEIGIRHGDLKVSAPHGDHFHKGRLAETSLMVAWKRSHFTTLRAQLTTQRDRGDFDDAASNVLMLQYVVSLGAHGAHAF